MHIWEILIRFLKINRWTSEIEHENERIERVFTMKKFR